MIAPPRGLAGPSDSADYSAKASTSNLTTMSLYEKVRLTYRDQAGEKVTTA